MATLLILILVALGLLWAGQRRLIYFPSADVPAPSAVGLNAAEQVSFTTEDGLALHGWFVPANEAPARFTVIVFNGNAGHRGMRAPFPQAISARGVAAFLFDYRGYGGNSGSPTEVGLTRDASAALAYVTSRPDVDSSRVVYFGESLGAAVALRLATERQPLALVLRSPFASLADVAGLHYPFLPVRLLLRDRYPNIDLVPRVASPILVIASESDVVIPIEQSQRVFGAAHEPKQMVVIEGADHNDFEFLGGVRLIDAVVNFVATVGLRGSL